MGLARHTKNIQPHPFNLNWLCRGNNHYLCIGNCWEELPTANGAICRDGEAEIRVVVNAVGDLVVQAILVCGYHLEERSA